MLRGLFVLCVLLQFIPGCMRRMPDNTPKAVLRLATTTSTNDSGLLEYLIPEFESQHDCRVDVIAVGTGAALRLGEAGDVDALIVHARDSELQFMDELHGVRHEEFMFNHFVLVGPPDDPAGVKGLATPDAFRKLMTTRQTFVSRGDESGTHKRETRIWESIESTPKWDSYLSVGQGMGQTLEIACEKGGYTLSDVGTFEKRSDLQLAVLSTIDEQLHNPYSVIVVNPNKSVFVNHQLADALADYLLSPVTQTAIANYEANGRQLFWPLKKAANP